MSTPTAGTTGSIDLAAALNNQAVAMNTVAERLTKIEHSSEAALKAAISDAREKVSAEVREDIAKSIKADLESKLKAFEAELAEKYKSLNRPGVSLADGVDELADALQACRAETKSMFRSHGKRRAADLDAYKRKFGDATPWDLVTRGCFVPDAKLGFKVYSIGTDDGLIREFQEVSDQLFWWRHVTKFKNGEIYPDWQTSKLWPRFAELRAQVSKALDLTDTSTWVPTSFSTQLIERYELERVLVGMLSVAMVPRFPFDWPTMGARTTTYKIAEQTADPESATAVSTSDLNDAKITFTRGTLGARTSWSYELDEDSIIVVATAARDEIAKSLAFTEEQVVLDGDTTSTHQDSDVTSAADARKLYKGLRKHCIANSYKTDISAEVAESFKGMIKSMGIYGAKYRDLLWALPPNVRADLLTLKDTNNNPVMIGIPVIAPQAYVQSLGDVPMLFGIKIAVCEAFRTDLNASGVYDSTIVSKTGVILLNTSGWKYAMTSAAPTIDSQKWIRTRQFEVVASIGRDFQPTYAIASNKLAWYGFNVTS